MGVRVRLSRNTSMYLPFWVAIPVWLVWATVVACYLVIYAVVWLLVQGTTLVIDWNRSRKAGKP